MAWRDSRKNRSRLFLFISSIILGIAALVAIYSFEHNLRNDIDKQAMSLIGADLVISSNRAISPDAQKLLDSLGDEKSQERTFVSMIYFPRNAGTRLVQIRALQGDFPFYGSLETTPVQAGIDFRKGRRALVDKTLMMQFKAQVGDSVKVGELFFEIAGTLNNAPGQTGISSTVAPAVYIPLNYLEETGLSQKGSRINYNFYYKYKPGTDVEGLVKKIDPRLEKESLNYDTVESRKESTGRSFADLTGFLALVGFIALLLGCIGVASAIHIYIREKISAIALLRCLGVQSSQAFLIYLIQIVGVGLIGSIVGAALGTLIQQLLPAVLQDFLPIQISVAISWAAIAQGIVLGVIISLLFAMLPLISVRNISPLNTLRLSFEDSGFFRDRLKWLIYILILLFIFAFTWFNMGGFLKSIYFTGGVLGAFLILTGAAWLLMWTARRYFPQSWSYLWRQGFANLFRPNNQTLILIVSIGLGSAFISMLFLVQDILISRVTLSTSNNQPNMVLFDIQTNQKEKVAALTRSYHLPVIQEVPIITMNLEEINGKTYAEAEKDTTSGAARGGFNREIRATYRDTLTASEKITEGDWHGKAEEGKPIYVSLETGYAERMHLKIGDSLVFNVQGVLTPVKVGSFRRVDWGRVQTNFRVLFPTGVLEEAPQFHVLITRVPSNEVSARFQQAVVSAYPNISIFDLGLILGVLDEILDKIGFVIRFMGGFSIITGLIVLIASVLISKYQRMQESVLLRTMGASRRQILVITALEYFFLGALAAATGILLSFAGSWALATYNFETSFNPLIWPAVIIFFLISLLTVAIGLFNSRGVLNRPPLEVLRREV
ncbi:MAG TPA: ABC transporter permease [Sphingobacteriaceae bacterium]|nr:ABC transporter permease [Sphingobacteriaceae bacterium]